MPKTKMTCPKCGKRPAREYLRVSVDKSGCERSPSEQHDDHARAAKMFGFCLCAKSYRDIGSASPHARKTRDDFDKLVEDLKRDRFGASLLVMWDASRGSRKSWEWGMLIELCKEKGVQFFISTHNRVLDPTNARDRRTMQEDGVDAEFASAKISESVTRAAAANAAAGKWHGRVPFGYKRLRDPVTGKTISQVPEPAEAKIVRELFRRLKNGHSFRSVEKDFEARGIRNDSGTPFSGQHLRSLALNATYIGMRVHNRGHRGRTGSSATAVTVPGCWKPLVDRQTFYFVQRAITSPERVTTRPGRGIHLLSMIAKCGVCAGPLQFRNRADRSADGEYACRNNGHVRLPKPDLDQYAERALLGYLARDDLYAGLTAGSDDDHELAAARDDVSGIRTELAELADLVALGPTNGGLSAPFAARAEPGIRARLAVAETRERELSTPAALTGILAPGKDVAKRWKTAPMSARREVARLVFSVDLLGELRVERAPHKGSRAPAAERVTWWRE